MSLILGFLFIVGVIAVGFWMLTAEAPASYVSRASLPMPTHTQIVCSNCAGDERLPRKTRLALLGREACCEQCGSHSYVLAASIAPVLAARIKGERAVFEQFSELIEEGASQFRRRLEELSETIDRESTHDYRQTT